MVVINRFAAGVRVALRESRDAPKPTARGSALENCVQHVLNSVPGVEVRGRDVTNVFRSGEVDLLVANDVRTGELPFLPWWFLVECKAWKKAVPAAEVRVFADKLRNRKLEYGVLVSLKGVTGSAARGQSSGIHIVANALSADNLKILVVTGADLDSLVAPTDVRRLFQDKIAELLTRYAV